jgi:hypothetical protein
VFELAKTILDGGLDRVGRPRLAVCRADARRCSLRIERNVSWFLPTGSVGSGTAGVPLGFSWPVLEPLERRFWGLVPGIPPQHRQPSLDGLYVLWEPEWSPDPEPLPALLRDPALIRYVTDDLCAVAASWHLASSARLSP